MTKNILYIAHRIPYPPNKGDKIRTFNEIKFLSRLHNVDLVAFSDNQDDLKYESDLKKYCQHVYIIPLNPLWGKIKGIISLCSNRSVSEGYFFDIKMLKQIAKLISEKKYIAIVCFCSPMAEYIFRLSAIFKQKNNRPKLIMDFCDVDSYKWRQYSVNSSFPMNYIYATEAKRLLMYEKKVNRIFDISLFVSQNEAELFKALIPDSKHVMAITNGVDFDYFSPLVNGGLILKNDSLKLNTTSNSSPVILFAGAMDYHANVEGVTWFCQKILPVIQKVFPDVEFIIAGSNPVPEVRELEKISNVMVTGFVKDIRPYYQTADVCVVPLRIARGIQNKVLEAMSMAKPVVATSAALDGIYAEPGIHFISADDAQTFASEVIRLLKEPINAESMGYNARKFIKKEFAWDTSLKRLEEILST